MGALARAEAGAAVVRAVARVRGAALRLGPPLAAVAFARPRAGAAFAVLARLRAGAAAFVVSASAAGVRVARLRVVFGVAATRAFARAGVSLAAAAAGVSAGVVPAPGPVAVAPVPAAVRAPDRAGRSRLALPRRSRVFWISRCGCHPAKPMPPRLGARRATP